MNYLINEVYYTIHGEGVRYGIPHVFVRFSQCNLACGFCDTEFESYTEMTGEQLVTEATRCAELPVVEPKKLVKGALDHGSSIELEPCRNVLFCGGEPLLQLDETLIKLFKEAGWHISIETNGTLPVPDGIDWVTCSPKVAEHAIMVKHANELKYVRGKNQNIPKPKIAADHYLISPMFSANELPEDVLANCVRLVMENPQWRLTMQHHKQSFGGMR